MMSLSKVGRYQATDYYSRDDYYTRQMTNEDFWYGNALTSPFAADISRENTDYQGQPRIHVAEYQSTVTDIINNHLGNSKRLALDLTFSPPKSVSIAALDHRYEHDIIMAHNAAITAVLSKVESDLIVWRKREGNTITPVKTGNMLAACLQHKVSRDEDPQLHTHVVLFRKTITEKGVGTIEDSYLFKNQRLLSAMYDAELSYQLQQRGFKISEPLQNNENTFTSSFEIAGISTQIITHFSNRRKRILDYLNEHRLENTPANREQATLKTRKSKRDVEYSELKTRWNQEIESLGGIHIEKFQIPNHYFRRQQLSECFKETVKDLSMQEFAFRKEDLQAEVLRRGVTIGITESDFEEVFSPNIFEAIMPIRTRTHDRQLYFTTPENLKIAKEIDALLQSGKDINPPMSSTIAHNRLKAIEERLIRNNGWTLSQGQREAIQNITTLSGSYMAIQGYAGTGKTTMLQYAKEILDTEKVVVKGMAFTGKAAQAIRDESGIPADTIHGFLNKICNKSLSNPSKFQWDFSTVKPNHQSEIWIVDESSMVNDRLLYAILDASSRTQSKVVFIGDKGQLLPIGTGNGFNRMVSEQKVPIIEIRDINRQKEGSDLRRAVEILADSRNPTEHPLNDFLESSIYEVKQRTSRINRLTRDYLAQTPEERNSSVILVGKNTDRVLLNNLIRRRLQYQELLPAGKILTVVNIHGKSEDKEFSIGERIMFLKNDRHITTLNGKQVGVMNGQTGVITAIKGTTLEVKSGDTTISVDTTSYNHIDYSYAMTSHKAQGITVKRAFVYHDSSQRSLNHRNRLYVDISRAKEAVFIYTDNKVELERQARRTAKKWSAEDFTVLTKTTKATQKVPAPQLHISRKKVDSPIIEPITPIYFHTTDKQPSTQIESYKRGTPQPTILVGQSKNDLLKQAEIHFKHPEKIKTMNQVDLLPMPQDMRKHIGFDKEFVHNKKRFKRNTRER